MMSNKMTKTFFSMALAVGMGLSMGAVAGPVPAPMTQIVISAQVSSQIASSPALASLAGRLLAEAGTVKLGTKFTGTSAQIKSLQSILNDSRTSSVEKQFLAQAQTLINLETGMANEKAATGGISAASLQKYAAEITRMGKAAGYSDAKIAEAILGLQSKVFKQGKGIDWDKCTAEFNLKESMSTVVETAIAAGHTDTAQQAAVVATQVLHANMYSNMPYNEYVSQHWCKGFASPVGQGCNVFNDTRCSVSAR